MSAPPTSGPWVWLDHSANRGGTIGTVEGFAICDMAHSYSSLDRDELDANARLIAAAPTMLAALRTTHMMLRQLGGMLPGTHEVVQLAVEAAADAIHVATQEPK